MRTHSAAVDSPPVADAQPASPRLLHPGQKERPSQPAAADRLAHQVLLLQRVQRLQRRPSTQSRRHVDDGAHCGARWCGKILLIVKKMGGKNPRPKMLKL